MKPLRFLYMLHLPPPFHGAALTEKRLLEMDLSPLTVEKVLLEIRMTDRMEELRRFRFHKVRLALGLLFRLLRFSKEEPFDVAVFAFTSRGWALLRDALLMKVLRHRSRHTIVYFSDRLPFSPGWVRRLLRASMRGCWVILHTPPLYKGHEELFPRERIFFLPNGLPVDVDDRSAAEWLARRRVRSGGPIRLLFLSHMVRSKGLFTLIEALSLLSAEGVDFLVTFVGAFQKEGDRLHFLKEIEGRGLSGKVSWCGSVLGDEKWRYYAEADIFVFPTQMEAFGNVAVEAMEAALPVVASREGSLPEIIQEGETGLLVAAGDSRELADAIAELSGDPERRAEFGRRGRERFLRLYTQRTYRERVVTFLERLLVGGKGE